jgi:hypothetical protein
LPKFSDFAKESIMNLSIPTRPPSYGIALVIAGLLVSTQSPAATRTAVNRNVNTNHNVNVNRNVNVSVDDNRDYHPVATAAAVTAGVAMTSAVIGSMTHSLPPACSAVVVNGLTYQNCGGAWYQPQYAGSQVTYVVVNPPR